MRKCKRSESFAANPQMSLTRRDGVPTDLTRASRSLHSPNMPKKTTQTRVKVRRATKTDIPELIRLNIAAYPVLAEDNIV